MVPFTSFSENEGHAGRQAAAHLVRLGRKPTASLFSRAYGPRWTSVRKVREGETTNDVFGFLTTEPNVLVGRYHPKAMPVILRTPEEIDIWMAAPVAEALALQRPLPDDALVVVLRGEKGGFGRKQQAGGCRPTPARLAALTRRITNSSSRHLSRGGPS